MNGQAVQQTAAQVTLPRELHRRGVDGSLRGALQVKPAGQSAGSPIPADPGLTVEEFPPTAEVVLGRLRRRYRRWGVAVLFDGRTAWMAVCTGEEPIVRQSPVALRIAVDAVVARRFGRGRGRS